RENWVKVLHETIEPGCEIGMECFAYGCAFHPYAKRGWRAQRAMPASHTAATAFARTKTRPRGSSIAHG
ncbi:MAG: hypothetical protein ACYC7B_12140, partial [Burkholderiales bacterium]